MRAHVFLGKGMASLGPVMVKDSSWLIERLVADRYCLHEAKLWWDKRRGNFALTKLSNRRPLRA